MTPILIAGPGVEPVSVAEMRAYLRLDDEAEDELVAALITAARLLVEAACGRQLVEQTWRILLDRWPQGRILRLPLSPLIRVDRVRVFDASGAPSDVSAALYRVEASSDPPRLIVDATAPEPGLAAQGIALDVVVGFGASAGDVPATLRQAVRVLVARWFEHRGDEIDEAAPLPSTLELLVARHRRARL